MTTRFYSSTAAQTNLTNGITSSSTIITVGATTGFPGSTPYTLALDYGSASEELVDVTSVAGLNLTVTRAVDGTSAIAHNAGAIIRHVSSGRDFKDSRDHENASTNVHGLAGGAAVVGTTSTQTLTNKTLTRATGTLERVDLFNTGTWVTAVIGDSANPSVSKFHILENEINLRAMVIFDANGGMTLTKAAAEADGTYRIRLRDSDLTTDRFAVLASGNVNIVPTSTSTTRIPLEITAPASMTTDMFRVKDATDTKFQVTSAGRTSINKRALIQASGDLTNSVLQVGSTNAGATGDLTQWVDPANTIVSRVRSTGTIAAPNSFDTLKSSVTTGVVTAAAGWSISSEIGIKRSGFITIAISMNRTGADLTGDANGGLADTLVCTLQSGWTIPTEITTSLTTRGTTGVGGGSIRLNADNTIQVVDWSGGGTIAGGSSVLRFSFTYPI